MRGVPRMRVVGIVLSDDRALLVRSHDQPKKILTGREEDISFTSVRNPLRRYGAVVGGGRASDRWQ